MWLIFHELISKKNEWICKKNNYVQWTISMILLLTDGGTPLVAMQRYEPMCSRFTLVILKRAPSTFITEIKIELNVITQTIDRLEIYIHLSSKFVKKYDTSLFKWWLVEKGQVEENCVSFFFHGTDFLIRTANLKWLVNFDNTVLMLPCR